MGQRVSAVGYPKVTWRGWCTQAQSVCRPLFTITAAATATTGLPYAVARASTTNAYSVTGSEPLDLITPLMALFSQIRLRNSA